MCADAVCLRFTGFPSLPQKLQSQPSKVPLALMSALLFKGVAVSLRACVRGHIHHIYLLAQKRPQTSWAIFILRWEDQLAVLCVEANKMYMRTVQQNVFLILNRMPVTFVTDPEPTRPSIPVMTHSMDQKVMARKAKARKCTAEIVGNIQAKVIGNTGCW